VCVCVCVCVCMCVCVHFSGAFSLLSLLFVCLLYFILVFWGEGKGPYVFERKIERERKRERDGGRKRRWGGVIWEEIREGKLTRI